jgi:D-alanine-D-alanine ligase
MGGLSPERNVSLSSGALIAAALRRKGHRVLEADVYLGVELDGKNIDELFTKDQTDAPTVAEGLPDLEALIAENG